MTVTDTVPVNAFTKVTVVEGQFVPPIGMVQLELPLWTQSSSVDSVPQLRLVWFVAIHWAVTDNAAETGRLDNASHLNSVVAGAPISGVVTRFLIVWPNLTLT